MISVELTPYVPLQIVKRKVKNGSEEHKIIIYERTCESLFNTNIYDPGSQVYVKGHHGEGVIIDIVDFDECEWDGLKVKPLEVWMYDTQKSVMAHPSDVKQSR